MNGPHPAFHSGFEFKGCRGGMSAEDASAGREFHSLVTGGGGRSVGVCLLLRLRVKNLFA